MSLFDPTSNARFQGLEPRIIESLLSGIDEAIYNYDQEICGAKPLFDSNNSTDAACQLTEEWFRLDDYTSHEPIAAALRQILSTPQDKQLPTLKNIQFSQVHRSLIYWFVLNILANENIYEFPTMKSMAGMMEAVVEFGNDRWETGGKLVLKEILLQIWHTEQFKQQINIDSARLIKRLEAFLKPLTGANLEIPLWSPWRATIIKKTVELCLYLRAVGGTTAFHYPIIGDKFDEKIHEAPFSDWAGEIFWVLRPGFCVKEQDGNRYEVTFKALVHQN